MLHFVLWLVVGPIQTVVSILFQTIVLILRMMREMIVFALMQIAIIARCNAMVARSRMVVLMVVGWYHPVHPDRGNF